MAESIVSDLVGRLLGYLGEATAGKIASYFGGRDKLKEVEQTMMMIQARLSDAERFQEGEDGALVKLWLKRLKNVLYRFEDLFEEISFTDKEMEHMAANNLNLTKAVCFPISKLSLLKMNYRVAKDVDSIMRELEGITSDMHRLHLRVHSTEGQRSFNLLSSRETHSFVLEEDIIGRDENKNEILQMLLGSDSQGEDLSVIPIVGIGGLGKTALAQLVYNDNNVRQHFELNWWVCISEVSSLAELAGKIYKSIIGRDCGQLSIEQLQSSLRDAVSDKKYLLVLDDVWDEDREKWLSLRRLLCGGKRGSKIIVTSRSKIVALNMGTVDPYELKGLPEEKSWELFRSLAFRDGQEEKTPNLTNIGRDILKKCANVPLAIRTIAGILYAKDTEEEWMHFKESDLRLMEQKENNIMSTLKLSYDHLPPQLKQCFAYCALFPKDHEFEKQKLIWLWMSQGFIEPAGKNQIPDDVGHAYFMELLRRCFFQDIRRNWYGRITRCKMHDLMHDLTLMVGDECLPVGRTLEHVNGNIRHVHYYTEERSLTKSPPWLHAAPQMRSHLLSNGYFDNCSILSVNKIISSFMFLRALDLGEGYYVRVPSSIGELKHLRYLRVTVLDFYLPIGITRLQNLQTLDLRNSHNLRRLPRGFNKLSNLRHLQIRCSLRGGNGGILIDGGELVDMPPRFGQLTSLQTLDKFIVGKNNGLDALAGLNLGGGSQIFFRNHRQNMKAEALLANLKEKKLTFLLLNWSFLYGEEPDTEAEVVLQCLQPPSTLKAFEIQEWKGVRFPRWGLDQIPCLLPNLVSIALEGCSRCQYLPSFSQLPHLKILEFRGLHALEYIYIGTGDSIVASSPPGSAAYFPALEHLTLLHLPKLKGWSSIEYASIDLQIQNQQHLLPPFLPRLLNLSITDCPILKSFFLVPNLGSPASGQVSKILHTLSCLESLTIRACDELNLWDLMDYYGATESANSSGTQVAWHVMKSLHYLSLSRLLKLESLPEWIGSLSQLRELRIVDCPKLTSLTESFRNLTTLQRLEIMDSPELKRRCESPNGEDWPLIQHVPEVIFSIRGFSSQTHAPSPRRKLHFPGFCIS